MVSKGRPLAAAYIMVFDVVMINTAAKTTSSSVQRGLRVRCGAISVALIADRDANDLKGRRFGRQSGPS